MKLEARNLAIDKPTSKLLQFMWKHYKLSKMIDQGNNFVIFEEFFDCMFNFICLYINNIIINFINFKYYS